eukprot:TRINITY_DN3790_c2_g1_i1.p1 TRINITY_DN3790_c2_g1~~TRINITY_DN3790_c2_g1_i1.p1  ORF type:complete len:323 (+),score=84.39 TRINITY_DN3790_c2_g1_i1:46-1014(+)
MSTAPKKDKKKNRLQTGGSKPKKKTTAKAGAGDVWKELAPDMTKAEEEGKRLHALKQSVDGSGEMPIGLSLIEDFITESEEKALLDFFNNQEWSDALSRRTQQWGYAFDYEEMTVVREAKPIPSILSNIIQRMASIKESSSEKPSENRYPFLPKPVQIIVNEYRSGQGIHPHVDRNCFGPIVASLGLGSTCSMQFDKVGSEGVGVVHDFSRSFSPTRISEVKTSDAAKSIFFKNRSLVLMTDDARTRWTHHIPARTYDENPRTGESVTRGTRVSITFRTLTEATASRVGETLDLKELWQGKAKSAAEIESEKAKAEEANGEQ